VPESEVMPHRPPAAPPGNNLTAGLLFCMPVY
jgi:hypothetical protein